MTHSSPARQRPARPPWKLVVVAFATAMVVLAATASASSAQTIQVNGNESGGTLQGVGGMSVSDTSRLLFDYPAAERSQILDYLFCSPMVKAAPGYCTHGVYGAALQRLKVEIGSGTDSTVGSEPTVEPERGVVNCNVGWEFKLMTAARERDPDIKIDALAWGFPGWIDPSGESASLGLPPDYGRIFGSQDAVGYLLNYLGCARANGTPINTLGIWNEIQYLSADRTQSEQWIAGLRQSLNSNGYSSVQIIADDNLNWPALGICNFQETASDTAFCKAVSFFGSHYPGPSPAWQNQQFSFTAPAFDGTWEISDTPGSSQTFTFSGTSIKWIADTCFNGGMADVYLDGQLAATDVDTYAPPSTPGYVASVGCAFQQVLFSQTGLSPGQHTIEIVVTSDHNPASAAPWNIYSDAFAIDGPPNGTVTSGPCSTQTCVDNSDPSIQYSSMSDSSGKPLIASEDAPVLTDDTDGINWYANPTLRGDWTGAQYLAQLLNTNYVGIDVTGADIYNLISSYYDQAQFAKGGLMIADTPWVRGRGPKYDVQSRIWVVAHTAQFTKAGSWRYVGDPTLPSDTASCYLGTSSCTDSTNETGSYVTLRAKRGNAYAVVAETKDATSPQPEQFCLSGGLGTGTVHVWETDASTAFSDVADLTPTGGCFSYTLQPDAVYTFTNERTGHHGATTQGYVDRGLSLPYHDNFQSYGAKRTQARYFMDRMGTFETGHRCPPGGRRWCLQQVTTTLPIIWPIVFPTIEVPSTIIGNLAWTDYDVQARLTIPTVGQSASVIGRMQRSANDSDIIDDRRYQAQVTNEGDGNWEWTLYRVDQQPTFVPLASGTYSNGSRWITVTLRMVGSQLSVLLDGNEVGSAADTTYTAGMAGLATGHSTGSNTLDTADFDDFCVQAPNGHDCPAH